MKSRKEILDALRKFKETRGGLYGITELGLFGSVARNEQMEKSDIDICVRLKNGTLFALYSIKEELEELFHTKVDVISLDALMRPLFRQSLEQDAIYI